DGWWRIRRESRGAPGHDDQDGQPPGQDPYGAMGERIGHSLPLLDHASPLAMPRWPGPVARLPADTPMKAQGYRPDARRYKIGPRVGYGGVTTGPPRSGYDSDETDTRGEGTFNAEPAAGYGGRATGRRAARRPRSRSGRGGALGLGSTQRQHRDSPSPRPARFGPTAPKPYVQLGVAGNGPLRISALFYAFVPLDWLTATARITAVAGPPAASAWR